MYWSIPANISCQILMTINYFALTLKTYSDISITEWFWLVIVVSSCYRGIGCGILLWLCFWWSCMAIVYSWQPCMDWWLRALSSYWALLLVTGWTKTPDWKVNMAKLQTQSMQIYCATWHIAESMHQFSVDYGNYFYIFDWVCISFSISVAQTSLVVQNSAVILCGVLLMAVFQFKVQLTTLYNGWLLVSI